MKHLVLLIICLVSAEILIKSDLILTINYVVKVSKKAIFTILNKSVSDQRKENIIPVYSLQIMKSSLKVVIVLLSIALLFVAGDYLSKGFLLFAFSSIGILESFLFAFGYICLRSKL